MDKQFANSIYNFKEQRQDNNLLEVLTWELDEDLSLTWCDSCMCGLIWLDTCPNHQLWEQNNLTGINGYVKFHKS